MAKKRGPSEITPQHKAAMKEGRAQSRVVSNYLEALRAAKPKRGRKRTPESIKKRLEAITAELSSASALDQLKLIQERRDLQNKLDDLQQTSDIDALERDFIEAAKEYGSRKNISYSTWREFGVEPSVLTKAGISRGD